MANNYSIKMLGNKHCCYNKGPPLFGINLDFERWELTLYCCMLYNVKLPCSATHIIAALFISTSAGNCI